MLQGFGVIGVGRLGNAHACEVFEDDVCVGARIEHAREVAGSELGCIADAGDYEAEFAGSAPHVVRACVGELSTGGDANTGGPLLCELRKIAEWIAGLGIDEDCNFETVWSLGGLLEEVGVVVGAAVLDEGGLVNAVAIHLEFECLDRLEPVVPGVAVRVDYQHLKRPFKEVFVNRTSLFSHRKWTYYAAVSALKQAKGQGICKLAGSPYE